MPSGFSRLQLEGEEFLLTSPFIELTTSRKYLNGDNRPVRGRTTKLESATMTGSVAVETGGLVEKRPNWATVRGHRRVSVNHWAETVRPKVAGSAAWIRTTIHSD